jgi:hypothetical protein
MILDGAYIKNKQLKKKIASLENKLSDQNLELKKANTEVN